ncbi:MAG: hypothetical protein WC222_00985 [Parachlamydiales bacterium]
MGWSGNDSSCCSTFDSCCVDECCEDPCCPCGPLSEGSFSLLVKGGVNPTHWTSRGKVWLTIPAAVPAVISFNSGPKFKDQYKLPYIVGGEVAYNLSCQGQVFFEANYLHADGKNHGVVGRLPVGFSFDDYQAWSWYLGGRYYFSRSWICDRVSPFVGLKAGFINHKKVRYDLTVDGVFVENDIYYHGKSGVSIGAQIGFDIQICDNISAIVSFEAVASGGPRANRNNELDPALTGGLTNVNLSEVGTEVSFPITLGLRYTF